MKKQKRIKIRSTSVLLMYTHSHIAGHIPSLARSRGSREAYSGQLLSLAVAQADLFGATSLDSGMQRQLSISAMPKLLPEEAGGGDDDDVEAKPEKAPAPRSTEKERSVHLIPLIIVICRVLETRPGARIPSRSDPVKN
nr:uncharacterized protein LOC117865685 isoform X2 [Setaria viridis]